MVGSFATFTAQPRVVAPSSIWRLAAKTVDPLVRLNDAPDDVPLYCIHPISGDVGGLRDLAGLLDHRMYGVQVPKGDMTAAFGGSIERMADRYADLVQARRPEGPIALAGWSAGAIIALEMAHRLRASGRDVPLLVALDGAPCNTGGGLSPWHPGYILRLAANLPGWIRDDTRQDWSWGGIRRRLESKLAWHFGIGATRDDRLSGIETMDAETVDDLLATAGWNRDQKAFIHAMYRAMIAHVPKPYDGRVLVYETTTQPLYHLRQIGAAWEAIAPDTEIVRLRGNHSGLVFQPMIDTIARHLNRRLADGAPSPSADRAVMPRRGRPAA